MDPISADNILEEAEVTRKSILDTKGFVIPEKISYIFEEYSRFFKDFTYSQWRIQERHEELIEYTLWEYEHYDGEEGWKQLLVDFWPERHLEKRRRFLKGLYIGRAEQYWSAINHQKQNPENIGAKLGVAIKKGKVLNIVYEMLCSIKDPDGRDKEYQNDVYELIHEILNEEKLPLPPPKKDKIDENSFWEIIEASRLSISIPNEFNNSLEKELVKYKAAEINNFRKYLYRCYEDLAHYDLWAVAYILNNGCSDDTFDYFRMWIITQGQEIFNLAIKDYEGFYSVVKSNSNCECQALLTIPGDAYFRRSGKQLNPKKLTRKIKGTIWSEEEIPVKYKNIWEQK